MMNYEEIEGSEFLSFDTINAGMINTVETINLLWIRKSVFLLKFDYVDCVTLLYWTSFSIPCNLIFSNLNVLAQMFDFN